MSGRKKRPVLALPKHVHRVQAKGRFYYYFQCGRGTREQAQRCKLPGGPEDPEFWRAYHQYAGTEPTSSDRGTFTCLISSYKCSPEFLEKSEQTKQLYLHHLEIVEDAWGALIVRKLKPSHVLALRDSMGETPGKANQLLRILSLLISWGIPRDYCDWNPCSGIKKLRIGPGFEPWPRDIVKKFKECADPEIWWPCALALYTGQRQSDVLRLRWSDIEGDEIQVRQNKTGKRLWIPVHSDLIEELRAVERRAPMLATNRRGRPWTTSGFRASWRRELQKENLSWFRDRGLVFHGLRKSAVVSLLEAGCTDAQVAAITGQTRQMVEHYALMVNQRRLAREGIRKWEEST